MVRIYPTFLAVFLLALGLIIALKVPDRIPTEPVAAGFVLLANLLLLPGLFPMTPIVTVAWSLSYEMFFYLAAGVMVLGFGMNLWPVARRVALILGLGAALLGLGWAGLPGWPYRMVGFCLGMLLAEGWGRGVPPWAGWLAPLAVFLGFAAGGVTGFPLLLLQSLACFLLCAVCFREVGGVSAAMSWTPLRWLGNMSYSYYLLHGFVVSFGMLVAGKLLPQGMPAMLFPVLMVVCFAGSVVASAVLFAWVERPISLRPVVRVAAG